MKNILLLFLAFTAFSCSQDAAAPVTNTPPEDNVVLVKKQISSIDGNLLTSIFNYEGSKLMSIEHSDGYTYNYTYQGDKLVMRQIFNGETVEMTSTYTYEGDQLSEHKSILTIDGSFEGQKTLYTYNDDSTISTQEYRLTNNGNTATHTFNGLVTFTNGNITSYKKTSVTTGILFEIAYTYDDKNDPFKNKLSHGVETLAHISGGNNNIVTRTTLTGSPALDFTEEYTFTYNEDNYPVTQTRSPGYTIEYFY